MAVSCTKLKVALSPTSTGLVLIPLRACYGAIDHTVLLLSILKMFSRKTDYYVNIVLFSLESVPLLAILYNLFIVKTVNIVSINVNSYASANIVTLLYSGSTGSFLGVKMSPRRSV